MKPPLEVLLASDNAGFSFAEASTLFKNPGDQRK